MGIIIEKCSGDRLNIDVMNCGLWVWLIDIQINDAAGKLYIQNYNNTIIIIQERLR